MEVGSPRSDLVGGSIPLEAINSFPILMFFGSDLIIESNLIDSVHELLCYNPDVHDPEIRFTLVLISENQLGVISNYLLLRFCALSDFQC